MEKFDVHFSHHSEYQRRQVRQPPCPCCTLSEQTAIIEYLEKATASIGTTIACARDQIDLLREYRTRLVADVVIGKLDVREAATALPEIDPLADEDELDKPIDADAEAKSDELDAIPEEVEA